MLQEVNHSLFGAGIQFSNTKDLSLFIPKNYGWRILSCKFEQEELFYQNSRDFLEGRDVHTWYLYGGHRLWHAPEDFKRSYLADNSPPKIEWDGRSLKLTTLDEAAILRSVEIQGQIVEGLLAIKLKHSFTNLGFWPVELAFWTITALPQKALGLIPLGHFKPHPESLLPKNHIVLWSYSNLQDKRFFFNPEYVLVKQEMGDPQKIGSFSSEGWLCGEVKGKLFLKIFPVFPKNNYPDRGANAEIFTNAELLELECLSPLFKIDVGQTLYFPELWIFHKRSKRDLYEDSQEIFQKVRHHIPRLLV